ncbi:MAG: xylulokinase [Pseudomonadota bacterium]
MYLGLDLGTSALKGVVLTDTQTLVAEARAPLTVARPAAGWSEQAPADWLSATHSVMEALKSQTDLGAIRAIGLSGHMHGATLVNKSGDVLRPCILWNDTRSHVEAAKMDAWPEFREISGNIVFPGFTAPKLAWIRENEPEIFDACDKVLLPKDYLRFWLTGEAVSEMSDAAGTAWLDVGKRDWSDTLLKATCLSRSHMPRLVEGSDASAPLRAELAKNWGLPQNILVAGGGGDNAATAVGVGIVKPGDAFVSLGTSGVLFAATDSFAPAPETAVHSFCHAVPDTWHQMGVILSAADALEWYARLVGQTPATLTARLQAVQAPGSTLFLPYLGGERTPHNDAQIRGALVGLEHATDTEAGTRAVLDGVSFALRDCAEALKATGTTLNSLIAVGGGSQSEVWLSAIATALNLQIDVPVDGDFGAAFGAARLAMMADGADSSIATSPSIDRSILPVKDLVQAYEDGYAHYRNTYPALRTLS